MKTKQQATKKTVKFISRSDVKKTGPKVSKPKRVKKPSIYDETAEDEYDDLDYMNEEEDDYNEDYYDKDEDEDYY
jgi:hypothetical protein